MANMYDHMGEVKVDGYEIRDGEVIIVFTNGQKLIESEARELAMGISEQVLLGKFMLQFAQHQVEQDAAQAREGEFKSSIPVRCDHVDEDVPDGVDSQCMKEIDHEGPHMYSSVDPPPAA